MNEKFFNPVHTFTLFARALTDKSRIHILVEEIERFLYRKMVAEGHYVKPIQGDYKPFSLFFEVTDSSTILGLHGGQIHVFSYTNTAQDEGIVVMIVDKEEDCLERFYYFITHPDKGHLQINFVWHAGPISTEQDSYPPQNHFGRDLNSFRISFRLCGGEKAGEVVLCNLKIVKEHWVRATEEIIFDAVPKQ